MRPDLVLLLIGIGLCAIGLFIFIVIMIKTNNQVHPKLVGDLIVCRTEKGEPYYFMQISNKDHFKIPKMKEVTLRVVDHGELTI